MKEIILKITFDDTDGYKGHGDDTAEIIKNITSQAMEMELESDGVIKKGWKIEIVK